MNAFFNLHSLKKAWNTGLKAHIIQAAGAFILLTLLVFCACLLFSDLRETLMSQLLSIMGNLDILEEDGSISALALFANNVRACTMIMLYGLIPFIRLPALALGTNAMMLGVLGAWYVSNDTSLLVYLAGILPHGILEFPAMILSFGVGLFVCSQRTLCYRKNTEAFSLMECIVLISRTLLFLLFPALALAAGIEAHITPLVLNLFL